MTEVQGSSFTDRLKTAAAAKQALLAKLKPKPTVNDPNFVSRQERKAAELQAVREARVTARAERAQRADEERVAAEAAALEEKRSARKERKSVTAAEAKARRDARYAARKARR